ncbi:MAG TPA: tetratricopeptide repeat protein [Methylophilaceae bacterium]|jgi:hypothetical protein
MARPSKIPRQRPTPIRPAGNEAQRLQQAIAFHQTGQLAQAQSIYEDILRSQPTHVDCLQLLGVIASQKGDYQRAADLIGKAIEITPNNPAFYANRAIALRELKQLEAAVASYDKAVALQPDYADAYFNRGLALQELKHMEAAVASYDKVIALIPHSAEAYYNRGLALQELMQLQAAIASYDSVIALTPNSAGAYYNRGTALQTLKQFDDAATSYDQAIALQPDYADAYLNRAITLQELKRSEAALASYDQAIALQPSYAKAWFNRGITLKELGQPEVAVASYSQAIALQSNYVEAYSNRGLALQELGQTEAAIASYDQAIALHPDYAEAYWNKSLALLLNGDFAQGWELYEWRWQRESFTSPRRNFLQPLWLGKEALQGKTILLHSEQGLGDAIQFCRYAKQVAALGARVILEIEKSLIGLLRQLEGVDELVERGMALPAFDFHCPLLSLPLAFKTDMESIPGNRPYLRSDPAKITYWANKLGPKVKKRVGIVWSGNILHKNDANRSLVLAELIAQLPQNIEYVSLQNDARDADKTTLAANMHIRHFGSELAEFTDTAALCELMDVVISVDTSVAHLSGALGKPTWILLPQMPDWRWLLNGDGSLWYASAKLYRQKTASDWDSVLSNVKADLINALDLG